MMFRLFLLLALLPLNASAQNIAATETTVPGGSLLLASYIGFFALLLGYLGVLSRRQSLMEDDLETLQRRIDSLVESED